MRISLKRNYVIFTVQLQNIVLVSRFLFEFSSLCYTSLNKTQNAIKKKRIPNQTRAKNGSTNVVGRGLLLQSEPSDARQDEARKKEARRQGLAHAQQKIEQQLTSTNSFSMNSTRDSANTGSQGGGPNSFTDTRLQAIKYLTEDMIKELETELLYYVETEQQPVLPGPIIYDWHSDWTDLTEKVVPKSFPLWQTKHGRDSHLKKSTDLGSAGIQCIS